MDLRSCVCILTLRFSAEQELIWWFSFFTSVAADGTMYGWGKDYLLPTKSYTPVPIMLGGDALVSKIWSRGRLAVATTVTGRIFAWGVSSLLNETVPAEITYSAEVTIGAHSVVKTHGEEDTNPICSFAFQALWLK
jgi:hypothetical protein